MKRRRKTSPCVWPEWVALSGNPWPVSDVLRGMGIVWDRASRRWWAAPEKWEAAQNLVDDEMARRREEMDALFTEPEDFEIAPHE